MKSAIPKPTLKTLMDMRLKDFGNKLNCVSVGSIVKFNAAKQLADIQINYKRVTYGNDIAPDTYEDYPVIVSCPVVVMQGGAGYLSFPIAPGDFCVVMFSDRELNTWVSSGQIAPPQDRRTHHLNDAIAIVGIRPATAPITYDAQKVKLFFANSFITIDGSGNIVISGSANISITGTGNITIAGSAVAINTV